MPFVLILIGGILVVSALQNTQGDLASALEQDVPHYLVWAAAIVAVGGLGYVPGLRTISRWLLALVLLAIFLKNYQNVISGFQNLTTQTPAQQATPTAQYASEVAASGGGGGGGAGSAIGGIASDIGDVAAVAGLFGGF